LDNKNENKGNVWIYSLKCIHLHKETFSFMGIVMQNPGWNNTCRNLWIGLKLMRLYSHRSAANLSNSLNQGENYLVEKFLVSKNIFSWFLRSSNLIANYLSLELSTITKPWEFCSPMNFAACCINYPNFTFLTHEFCCMLHQLSKFYKFYIHLS